MDEMIRSVMRSLLYKSAYNKNVVGVIRDEENITKYLSFITYTRKVINIYLLIVLNVDRELDLYVF